MVDVKLPNATIKFLLRVIIKTKILLKPPRKQGTFKTIYASFKVNEAIFRKRVFWINLIDKYLF